MNRTVATGGTALVVAVALSGCSLLGGSDGALRAPSDPPTASRTPASTATPTQDPDAALLEASATPRAPTPVATEAAVPDPALTPIPAGTVLTEGDVASPKGSIHFHYRVVADGDDTFTAQYTGVTSSLPVPVGVGFFERERQVGDGLTYPGVGDTVLGGPTPTPVAKEVPLDGSGVDPSGLVTLVVASAADAGRTDLPIEIAAGKVLAVAPVRWSVPERQTNVHPVDGGSRANAAGPVTASTASGAPRSYTVARDDLIGDVAARFGISVKALVWLNADVQVFGDDQYLYAGTTLNLDPLAR
ncbi:LysM domain-containing protein [Curtobacterium sp. MCSS17_008]|uniref:LysM peptidoglycan-binding domain-containing protein n=1 Tax=Curtobacterium sp. MCSS17_008 TaxID=2175647 RepID=UPI000DAA7932|nr:LysM peptidoglycan-binding domain-containing protein [Curtobacterium sp. MCSS17_008]PZF58214.1 LysM domain-containing protein [Curtobacterium sp. MCSS17_008]